MVKVYLHIRKDKNEIFYVGIAKQPERPYDFHPQRRSDLWNKIYNKTEVEVKIVAEDLSWEEACEYEKVLIKKYGRLNLNEGTLVNLTDGGDGAIGLIRTEEHRERLSKSQIGKVVSEETKKRVSEGLKRYFAANPGIQKGREASEETKKKLSEIGKLRPYNPESIEAMRQKNLGKKHSEEHRKKLSDKAKQRPPMSEEIRKKISESVTRVQTGKPCKEETKRKISEALKRRNQLLKNQ